MEGGAYHSWLGKEKRDTEIMAMENGSSSACTRSREGLFGNLETKEI
jgi:hypothetical protein